MICSHPHDLDCSYELTWIVHMNCSHELTWIVHTHRRDFHDRCTVFHVFCSRIDYKCYTHTRRHTNTHPPNAVKQSCGWLLRIYNQADLNEAMLHNTHPMLSNRAANALCVSSQADHNEAMLHKRPHQATQKMLCTCFVLKNKLNKAKESLAIVQNNAKPTWTELNWYMLCV